VSTRADDSEGVSRQEHGDSHGEIALPVVVPGIVLLLLGVQRIPRLGLHERPGSQISFWTPREAQPHPAAERPTQAQLRAYRSARSMGRSRSIRPAACAAGGLRWSATSSWAACSTRTTERPPSQHWRHLPDVNAGARFASGAPGRAVGASDRHPNPWRRARMAPLCSPSSHRRTCAHLPSGQHR
jgi:hypothetical protein